MDINSFDNGYFAVFQTKKQFFVKIGEELIGPFNRDKETVLTIYNMLKATNRRHKK